MGIELTTLVVIGTDWIGSCKSSYPKIMTTTTPVVLNTITLTLIGINIHGNVIRM
jgi:hypothetical protein